MRNIALFRQHANHIQFIRFFSWVYFFVVVARPNTIRDTMHKWQRNLYICAVFVLLMLMCVDFFVVVVSFIFGLMRNLLDSLDDGALSSAGGQCECEREQRT